MAHPFVLVVDDEPSQGRLISDVLEDKLGFRTQTLDSGQDAVSLIQSEESGLPDVVLLDLSTPEMTSADVIRAIKPLRPNLPFIVLTAYGDIDKAALALKAGATDFLAKPVSHTRLRTSINNALKIHQLSGEVTRLRRARDGFTTVNDLIGESRAMAELRQSAMRSAATHYPQLITGESGSGKKLLARAIHGHSARAGRSFISVHADSFSPEVLDHAESGTLFISHIEQLSAQQQSGILAHAESLVGSDAHPPSVRLIASASHAESVQPVLTTLFAKPPIRVPSLAERRDDIGLLAEHFLRRSAAMENNLVQAICPEAVAMLKRYHWPNNVRQLENIISRAVLLCDDALLEKNALHPLLPEAAAEPGDNGRFSRITFNSKQLSLCNEEGNLRRLYDLEADMIYFAVHYYNGRMSEVARRLGIGRSTLYRKVNDLNIKLVSP